jgi:hypothetical protein
MTAAFWFSYAVLWFLVLLLGLLVVLLYRQFGLTYMSGQRRMGAQGLDVGSRAPDFVLSTPRSAAQAVEWLGEQSTLSGRVLVFASPSCGVCADLDEESVAVPTAWDSLEFIWIDQEGARPRRAVEDADDWVVGWAAQDRLHGLWDVSAVPFAFAVAADGEILGKQIVNRGSDLDRLAAAAFGNHNGGGST